MTERGDEIVATYEIETAWPLEAAAESMAGEQSSGTFVKVAHETEELKAQHAARVIALEDRGRCEGEPALPGAKRPRGGGELRRAQVVLGFPMRNVGPSLPNLMTTVAGNLFELGMFSGLRLIDIEVPKSFADAFEGPQFGIEGTRRLLDLHGRPLIGTIVKPSVGLTPEATAELVKELIEAGLDFIKDDELIASPPYSPVEARAKAVMEVIRAHEDATGRKAMYAFNISGTIDEMRSRHDAVLDAGGLCVMVNILSVGLSGLQAIRAHSSLPLHAHRNGWGMLSRCPSLGMDYRAFQKFWRLAGADHMHVNGLRNKFCEPDESVIASARCCQTPIHGRFTVMPVFSSGQSAEQVPDTYQALGNADLMYLAGGGILGHPGGARAGVASLRQAWEAAMQGESLERYAASHRELREALEAFGRK